MKIFFGFDVTENKNNDRMDGDVFVTRRVSAEQEQRIEKQNEDIVELQKNAELHPVLRIVRTVTGAVALIGGAGSVRGILEVGFVKALRNAPLLLLSVFVCAIVWGILFLMTRRKGEKVYAEESSVEIFEEHKETVEQNYQTLGVPAEAPEMDVIMFFYRRKGEKIKVKSRGVTEYINFALRVFTENDALCFADVGQRWEIPLEEITGIREIKKAIFIPGWNKETPYNKGEYKPYKINANNLGQLRIKPYYALCIRRGGKDYELYFPPYELPLVERLTGFSVWSKK